MYIFPVQANFENPIIENLKNALIMFWGIFHIPSYYSLSEVLLLDGQVSYPLYGFALISRAGLMGWKYIPNEIEEDLEKSGEKFI